MEAVGYFLIKPLGKSYNYKVKGIIVSTSLEDATYTNRIGVVESIPKGYKGNIKSGYYVIVGHNVFRTYYNMKGKRVHSSSYFMNDTYILGIDEIYMYSKENPFNWIGEGEYCAIKPLKNKNKYITGKYMENNGILEVINNDLKSNNLKIGQNVIFKSGGEYKFNIKDELLYIMRSRNVFIVKK